MPVPNPFPCGGAGQVPCPPTTAEPIILNPGDQFVVNGQQYAVPDEVSEDSQGDENEQE